MLLQSPILETQQSQQGGLIMSNFNQCPRCGLSALEHLSTHSHCWDCSYSPEPNREINLWRKVEYSKEYPKHQFGRWNSGQAIQLPDSHL